MKATIEDVIRFSFCPKYYEQNGPLVLKNDLSSIVNFVFRKTFETGKKLSFKKVEEKFSKLYFQDSPVTTNDLTYNKSLIYLNSFYKWYCDFDFSVVAVNYKISASLYSHEINGEVPVILKQGDNIVLVFTEELLSRRLDSNSFIRYVAAGLASDTVSAAFDSDYENTKVINLSLSSMNKFTVNEFKVDKRFWLTSIKDLLSLLTSMDQQISYPNTLACRACPISDKCVF